MSAARIAGVAAFVAVAMILPCAVAADDLVESGHVRIRARVEPATAYVGQRVEVVVDVLTATWFLQAPRYPDGLPIDDAVVLPPQGFGTNFSERIDGVTYAGQTRKITIFATRPGPFEIPPFEITTVVADDDARPTDVLRLATPPLRFEARLPDEARGLGLVVATPAMTATQRWDGPADGLRAGDTLTRSIATTIENSPAMLLPVPPFEAPEGVAVYADRPEVSDDRNRGALSGTRTDSATYVFEREGRHVLPDVVLRWYDLGEGRVREEVLAGLEVEVAPNPELAAVPDPVDDLAADPVPDLDDGRAFPWRGLLAALAAAAVVLVSGRRIVDAIRRRGPPDGEPDRFRALVREARSGDPTRALRAAYAWLDRLPGPGRPVNFEGLASRLEDPEFGRDAASLAHAAVVSSAGPGRVPDGWIASARRARERVRRTTIDPRISNRLRPLNPR